MPQNPGNDFSFKTIFYFNLSYLAECFSFIHPPIHNVQNTYLSNMYKPT